RDSIIRGVAHPVLQETPNATSTYSFTGDHNDYDTTADTPTLPVSGLTRTEANTSPVDPLFLNPISGANGINGDYRLAHDSLAIDAGSSTAISLNETDLRGLTRIVAGAPPFTTVARDLGAYEYQHAAPVAAPAVTPASVAP